MAIEFEKGKKPMAFKSDRRLCLTRDKSRVVEADDKRSGFIFATPGSEITDAEVSAYGLTYLDGKVVLPQAEKALKKGEDKALKRGGDKTASARPPDREKR